MKREYLEALKVYKRPSDVGDFVHYQPIGRAVSKYRSTDGVLERARKYKQKMGLKFVDGEPNPECKK